MLFATLKQAGKEGNVELGGLTFDNCSIKDEKFAMMQKGCMYAGLLMPFIGHEYTKKKKVITAVQHILAESLKQSNDIQKFVTTTHALLPFMDKLVKDFAEKQATDLNDDEKYALACSLIEIKDLYHAVTLLHVAMTFQKDGSVIDGTPRQENINVAAVQGMLDTHSKLNELIECSRLRNIHKIKPMIDGKGIQLLYECKPGKHMKPIMDECVKF